MELNRPGAARLTGILAVTLFAALGADDCGGGDPPPLPACDCYYSGDCPGFPETGCNLASAACGRGTKFDGKCTESGGGDIIVDPPVIQSGLQAFTRAFNAYLKPVAKGGGHPDQALWESVDEVVLPPLTTDGVRIATNVALEITLGFDFNLVYEGFPQGPGNIRIVSDKVAALAMVRATRDAVLLAVENQDPDAVAGPINEFWAAHPDFHPDHTGRCYPHGHPDVGFETPAECQVLELASQMRLAFAELEPAEL